MINNQKEFDILLQKALEKVIIELCDKTLKCLRQHIMDDVYNADSEPNTWYVPTFEFLDSFKFEGMKSGSKEVSNNLIYDWASMSLGDWIHGNQDGSIDRRESLASILNVSGKNGDYDFRGKERNMFWDNALKEINQNFNKWTKDACNKYLK
jgi:hypothetical protein